MAEDYVTENVEAGKCPYCGRYNITYGDFVPDNDSAYYEATCDDCGGQFKEWYNLEFTGHTKLM